MREQKFEDERNLKVVISPVIAKKLCDKGYPIVKIKKKRCEDKDNFGCNIVFLFESTEGFLKDFNKLTEKQ